MWRRLPILLLMLVWLLPSVVRAERLVVRDSVAKAQMLFLGSDSLHVEPEDQADKLYDSIRTRSEQKGWSRTLYRALVRSERDSLHRSEVTDEDAAMRPYEGRRISAIRIERLAPFDDGGNWFEQAANSLHTQTRHRIIHRDLLFKVGEPLDPHTITRTEQLLQSRRYISEAVIYAKPDPFDPSQVEVIVRTRDSWTLDVDASLHSHGESSLGLSEANLFGLGHEVRLETNLNYRTYDYGGNLFEYDIPNVWGSFYAFNFAAGRSFRTTRFQLGLQKEFLQPTDYELGATFSNDKMKHRFLERDTVDLVKRRNLNLWGGYSRQLEAIDASVYLAARYLHHRVAMRPDDTSETNHPLLHDEDALLFGVGIYREHFYTTNMLYGYGQREYLASGFKTELVGGYSWREFQDYLYVGASHSMGGHTSIGYLMGHIASGIYIDTQTNRHQHGVVDGSLQWFSHLHRHGRSRLRHFVGLSYTYGWNRMTGADEQVRFTKEDGLHLLKDPIVGTNRLVLNTESVLFTPYQPYGFKVALFGFVDGGLIGYNDNIFRNDGFVSLGVGVRVRNERLVFRAIQLRLGVTFGPGGWADSNWIRFSSVSALQPYRYRPSRPEYVAYE